MAEWTEEGALRGRFADTRWLHPRCREQFTELRHRLTTDWQEGVVNVWFCPFETYRTPVRQQELHDLQKGVTGARAYESAHQFGMAVDFVPKIDGIKWSWAGNHPWDHLKKRANEVGLSRPYSWDLAHIESPLWQDWRDVMRSI